MRKIVYAIVGVFLIFSSVFLSACKQDEKFFKNTQKLSTEFFENQKIQFIFSNNQTQLEFNPTITQLIVPENPSYYALSDVYSQTLKSLTFMYTSYQSNLNLEPKHKTGNVKKLYKDFENRLQSLEAKAKQLLLERDKFELAVGSNPNSDLGILQLNILKTFYKDLILEATHFHSSFEKLYTSAFLAYPKLTTKKVEDGTQKLLTTVAVGKIATANANYIFDDKNGRELKNYNTNLLTVARELESVSITPITPEEQLTLENLALYLQTENAFDTELNQFLVSANKVNLAMYELATDKTAYLKEGNNVNYYNKIQRFLNYSAWQYVENIKNSIG